MQAFYTALGVSVDVVDKVVGTLQLRWCPILECLLVCDVLGAEGGTVSMVKDVLLIMWRFEKWSDARVVKIGKSGCLWTFAEATGFGNLVAHMREHNLCSEYYIHGYDRLTVGAKRFLAEASLASRPVDSAMLILTEDPRLVKVVGEVQEVVREEMAWIGGILPAVLDMVARGHHESGFMFRSECLAKSHDAIAWCQQKGFQRVFEPPFVYCRGDKLQNVRQIVSGPEPSDDITWEIWAARHVVGWPEGDLVKGLANLEDSSFTSFVSEQQHGMITSKVRHHPDMEVATAVESAMALQMMRLTPEEDEDVAHHQKLCDKLRNLKRKQPELAGGHQQFVYELWEVATSKAARKQTQLPKDLKNRIMARHGALYAAKPIQERVQFAQRAADRAAAKRREINEEIEYVRAQKQLFEDRTREKPVRDRPLQMSECRLTEGDLRMMSVLMKGSDFNAERVGMLRSRALEAPLAWEGPEAPANEVARGGPAWMSPVCWARDSFARCVFQFNSGPHVQYYKFLGADQSPLCVRLGPLELVGPVVSAPGAERNAHEKLMDSFGAWRLLFKINDWFDVVSLSAFPGVDESQVHVIPGLVHLPKLHAAVGADAVPLPEWFNRFPPPPRAAGNSARSGGHGGAPAGGGKSRGEAVPGEDRVPDWVVEHLRRASSRGRGRGRGRQTGPVHDVRSSSSEEEPGGSDDNDDGDEGDAWIEAVDQDVDRINAELEAARAEYDASHAAPPDQDLQVAIEGGAAAERRHGVAVRGYVGRAKSTFAANLCTRFSVPHSASYAISARAHDDRTAAVLARCWCHRMHFFYNQYTLSPDTTVAFIPEQIASYVEPTELAEAERNNSGAAGAHSRARIAQLRRLFQ